MSSDDALARLHQNVPHCLAVGLVHMTTGMLLGVKGVDSQSNPILDFVAAATAELYRGSRVSAIESLFETVRGAEAGTNGHFQEIVIFSKDLVHVLHRCKKSDHLVLVVVCRRSGSLGTLLSTARSELEAVEGAA